MKTQVVVAVTGVIAITATALFFNYQSGRLFPGTKPEVIFPNSKVEQLPVIVGGDPRVMHCHTTCLGGTAYHCCSGEGWIWCEDIGPCDENSAQLFKPIEPYDLPTMPELEPIDPVDP